MEFIRVSGTAYFDTYRVYDESAGTYRGIIEHHCRGVKNEYFVGWHFKDETYIIGVSKPAETRTFDTEEEALNFVLGK